MVNTASLTCGALPLRDRRALLLLHCGAHRLIHHSAVLLGDWLALLPVDDGALLGVHQATLIMALWLIKAPGRQYLGFDIQTLVFLS